MGEAKVALEARVTVKLLPVEKSTKRTPELVTVLIVPNDCLLTITVPLRTPPVLSYLVLKAALPETCAVSAALIPALPEACAVDPTINAALPEAWAALATV